MCSVFATSLREIARQWVARLASYRRHLHEEHLEALIEETARYVGLRLENDLSRSSYWSEAPLARRVSVLLYLVDRGVVDRLSRGGRRTFEPVEHAEAWVAAQPDLLPYLEPTLELLAALRRDQIRRTRSSKS